MWRDGFPLHDDLEVTGQVTETGAFSVEMRVVSAYEEISIARAGAVVLEGASLRFLGASGMGVEADELPLLIWIEGAEGVPFGARIGRAKDVDLGVEVY